MANGKYVFTSDNPPQISHIEGEGGGSMMNFGDDGAQPGNEQNSQSIADMPLSDQTNLAKAQEGNASVGTVVALDAAYGFSMSEDGYGQNRTNDDTAWDFSGNPPIWVEEDEVANWPSADDNINVNSGTDAGFATGYGFVGAGRASVNTTFGEPVPTTSSGSAWVSVTNDGGADVVYHGAVEGGGKPVGQEDIDTYSASVSLPSVDDEGHATYTWDEDVESGTNVAVQITEDFIGVGITYEF